MERKVTPLSAVKMVDLVITAASAIDLAVEWGHLTPVIRGILIGLTFSYGYRQIIAGTIGTLVRGFGYKKEVKEMEKAANFTPNVKAFAYGLRMFSHDLLWPSVGAVVSTVVSNMS